ncbi:MAG: helix-turn-helix domain-containing protein [Prevotella sp.]
MNNIDSLIENLEKGLEELKIEYGKEFSQVLFSCREAAHYLGKSPVTISRYIRSGKLSKTTINGRTGLLKSEINKLM